MPLKSVGPSCARRGCPRPMHVDPLCGPCLQLARLFKREPRMFAYEPVDGYRNERDAVELPWERWEDEAGAQGKSVVDLIAEPGEPA